mgnify:CR=1 FL=1
MMLSNSWLGNTSNYLSVEVAVNIRKLGTLPESQEAGQSQFSADSPCNFGNVR